MGDGPDQVVDGLAEPAFVERVLDAVQSLGTELQSGFEQDRTLFMLAVSEITTNIVMLNKGKVSVRVELDADPQELRAVIHDTASPAPVDVDDVKLPGVEAESGRGLALAHAVLDGLRHESGPAGNTWTLWRTLRAP